MLKFVLLCKKGMYILFLCVTEPHFKNEQLLLLIPFIIIGNVVGSYGDELNSKIKWLVVVLKGYCKLVLRIVYLRNNFGEKTKPIEEIKF